MEQDYKEIIGELSKNETIKKSLDKTIAVLDSYDIDRVRIAYSGGSDSDDVLWITRILGYNIPSVFYKVGIEYQATYNHIDYMRSLGFNIEECKPKYSIPYAQRKYGTPFLNKYVSEMIQRLQSHNFKFKEDGNKPFEELMIKYPNTKNALLWWTNRNISKRINIDWNKGLKEFLIETDGVPFKVSSMCCEISKKNLMRQYAKDNKIELVINGVRRAEGGRRSTAYSSCFLPRKNYKYDMYFPLFWWSNADKEYFDSIMNIKHSDCYSVYGLNRTGCPGCPYGRGFEDELLAIETYEPKLTRLTHLVFDKSYEFTRQYREFVKNNFSKSGNKNKKSQEELPLTYQ